MSTFSCKYTAKLKKVKQYNIFTSFNKYLGTGLEFVDGTAQRKYRRLVNFCE